MADRRCRALRATLSAAAVLFVSCATAPQRAVIDPPSAWTARGNEPFWRLDHGERWRLSMIGLTVEGSAPRPRVEGGRRIYEGRIDGRDLQVVLADRLCRDTMTGMPHPWTAQLQFDGRALAGCAGEPRALLIGRWRVVAVDGLPWPAGEALLAFDDAGRLHGGAGCNAFSARWALSGEGLSIAPGAATLKACPPPLAAAEQSLFGVLREAVRFDLADDGSLLLHAAGGRSLRAKRDARPD